MGRQIIQQPDGLYSVFSTSTDDFSFSDATPEMIIDWLVEQERERIAEIVTGIVAAIERGEKPYFQFTLTYSEAKKANKCNLQNPS